MTSQGLHTFYLIIRIEIKAEAIVTGIMGFSGLSNV